MNRYDLKIEAIQGLDESLRATVDSLFRIETIKTEPLRGCAINYWANLERLRSLSRLPFDISRESMSHMQNNVLSWLLHSLPQARRFDEQQRETKTGEKSTLLQRDRQVHEEANKDLEELDRGKTDPDEYRRAVIETHRDLNRNVAEIWLGPTIAAQLVGEQPEETPEQAARTFANSVLGVRDIYRRVDEIRPALEAWIDSLFVSAWSVFEDMAGGLWEAAVNEHPSGLALLRGGSKSAKQKSPKGIDSSEDAPAFERKQDGRSIEIEALERPGPTLHRLPTFLAGS
jgi:hypothetical protein